MYLNGFLYEFMVFYHLLSTEFTGTHPYKYKSNKIDLLDIIQMEINRATKFTTSILLGP